MRTLSFRCSAILLLGLFPAIVRGETKVSGSYAVRPSTQTVSRRQAVLDLARSKDPGAGEKLVEALGDKDAMTRGLAAQGLGTLKYAKGRPALAKALSEDTFPEVRRAAASSLRQIQDPQAVGALSLALKDSAVNVRLTALSGLSFYRDPKSRLAVEAACKDKSVEVRKTAVHVLGRLEEPASIPVIQQLLKTDPDKSVQAAAAEALGALHSKESLELLKPALKSSSKILRVSAARSILMLGDPSGLSESMALDKDSDPAVRSLAIDALGWSKSPSAETELKALSVAAQGPDQIAIQEALNRTQQLRKQ